MKKILLLLCTLLTTVVGWATTHVDDYISTQVTGAAALVDGGLYAVRVNGGSWITESEGQYVAPNAQNAITAQAVFQFNTSDEGATWTVKNLTTNNYWGTLTGAASSGTFAPAAEAASWTFAFNGSNVTAASGGYFINRSGGVMHGWGSGINLQIYQIIDGFDAVSATELSNTKSYTLYCKRGFLSTSEGHLANTVKAGLGLTAKNFAILTHQDKTFLYSVEDAKFVGNDGALGDTPAAITLNETTAPTYQIKFGDNYLNATSGATYGALIDTWSTPDDGNQYYLIEADDFDSKDAMAVIYEAFRLFADGKYYLNNVGTGKYLAAGSNWGTHAVVNADGLDYDIKMAEGKYTLDSQVSNGGVKNFLNGEWNDGDAFGWTFNEVSEGVYTISNGANFLTAGENGVVTLAADASVDAAKWTLVPAATRAAAQLATLDAATAESGVDATFLIKGANFNRNDLRNAAWTATKSGGNQTIGGPNGDRASYGCESWNNTFEVSQTLENIPEGVYEFSIAGYGTNGTTYVFANETEVAFVNTTGAANFGEALDAIAAGEYKGNTTGQVNVIGETLKIGVKRTVNSSADWAVFDNARLTYYGAVPASAYQPAYASAMAAAKAALDNEDYAAVTGEEKTALAAAIETYSSVEETIDAYKTAISALSAATLTFTGAKGDYDALVAAKAANAERSYKYADADKKAAAEATLTAEPTSAADAAEKAAAIWTAFRKYADSHALAEGVEGAINMTAQIVNPNAEEAIAEPWSVVLGEGSGGSLDIKDGEPLTDGDGNTYKYFDGGNWGANAWDVALKQTITLPAGKYMITVSGRASGDVQLSLLVGEEKTAIPAIGASGALFGFGWDDASKEFELEESGNVVIGVQGVTEKKYNWMSFTRFRLVCLEKGEEPVGPTDYTDRIVNADLTSDTGWDTSGTKGYHEVGGVVTAGNNAQFDFKQTIENLPAGQYKLTAQAAYRYSGSEADEYAAMQTDAITKFASLYATVGTKTVNKLVQNRYDGASETNYAEALGENKAVQVNGLWVPNSTAAIKAWFTAGKYVNEVVFNLPADGAVTIGIVKTAQPEVGDYTVIGPWTLTRLGDAEVATTYTVYLADGMVNGTVEADKYEAEEGEMVHLTITPNEGYELDKLTIQYNDLALEPGEDYSFAMPAADVYVAATFKEKPELKPGDDATSYITNPSFETGDLTGWTVGNSSDTGVKLNSDGTYTTEGCDGDYLFNTWWQGLPITQTVTGLPNGQYELKALMANDAITAGNKPCLYLLANGEHSEAFSSDSKGVFAEGSLLFYVIDGTATIGAIGGNADGSFNEGGYYWYKVDHFRLTYVGGLPSVDEIEIPEGKMSNAAAAAIATAKEAGDAAALMRAVEAAKASIAAYAVAAEAIAAAKAIKDGTNVATAEATATFAAAIEAIETSYNDGSLSDDDAKAAGATLGTIVTGWREGADGAAVKFMESAYGLNGFDAALYINTWSNEGETDGSGFKVPFYEYFTDKANVLGANTFTTTINGLEPGEYTATALIRVALQNDAEGTPAGVTFYANDGDAVAVDAEATAYGSLYLKEVTAEGIVGEDGVLAININVAAENNVHWLAFKNVKFEKKGAEPTTYAINISAGENGKVESDKAQAAEGETVTITVTPDEGYMVDEVSVTYGEDQPIEWKTLDMETLTGTFLMPASDVNVAFTFKVKEEKEPEVTATLVHTAGTAWGSNTGKNTVDTAAEYYNNEASTSWAGAAFAEFDFSNLPNGATITEATLFWNATNLNVNGNRDNKVYYLNAGQVVDYEDIVANENAHLYTGVKTLLENVVTLKGTSNIEGKTTATDALNELLAAGQKKIIFQFTGNGGGANLHGKAAEDAPQLVIKYMPGAPELANPNFDENPDDVVTVTTQGYQRNVQGDQVAGMQAVTGWTPGTQTESDPGYTGGVFAYDSKNLLNNKVAAPAAGPNGEAGVALGLAAVWAGVAQYTQEVTLPAGDYMFTYVVYNGANTGEVAKNLFGFIATDGTEYLSEKKTFTVGEWESVEVPFTVANETTGKISVGFIGSGGSGNAPHLFVDHVALTKIPGIELAKAELQKAIDAAQAEAAKYVVGEELFMYPASEIAPLTTAIATATDALNDAEATKESITDATTVLNAAVEAFAPQAIQPDAEKSYSIFNKQAQLYMTLSADGISIAEVAYGLKFEAAEGGKFYITDGTYYVGLAGTDNWSMTSDPEKKEALTVSVKVVDDVVFYTFGESKGLVGADYPKKDNKGCWANKGTGDGDAVLWTIAEYVAVGIKGLATDDKKAAIYDLSGRKVEKMVKGNIYIVNGKKVSFK